MSAIEVVMESVNRWKKSRVAGGMPKRIFMSVGLLVRWRSETLPPESDGMCPDEIAGMIVVPLPSVRLFAITVSE